MKTRTQIALYYHIDIKHTEYWEIKEESKVKEEGDGEIKCKTETIEAEKEVTMKGYKCNYCERYFLTG